MLLHVESKAYDEPGLIWVFAGFTFRFLVFVVWWLEFNFPQKDKLAKGAREKKRKYVNFWYSEFIPGQIIVSSSGHSF